jgi:hypothetical protein
MGNKVPKIVKEINISVKTGEKASGNSSLSAVLKLKNSLYDLEQTLHTLW